MKLPENYNDLSEQEQKAARRLRGAQLLWKLYEIELACECDDINRAVRFGQGLMGRLPSIAGNVFSDGKLLLEDLLIQLQQEWSRVVHDPSAEPCPLNFTKADEVAHEKQFALWAHSIELMIGFLDSIGGFRGWDGWVPHDQYKVGKKNMERFKQDFVAKHATTEAERLEWLEVWPFKD